MGQRTHAYGVTGIYAIVHRDSGLAYVGSSVDIGARWRRHRSRLRRGVHGNPRLQAAWTEHGERAFDFLIMETVELDDLLAREQAWLDRHRTYLPGNGYNVAARALGGGYRFTEEQRARVATSMRGKPKSEAHRAALRGIPRSATQLAWSAQLGKLGAGRPKTAEHRQRIGAAQQGSANHWAKLDEAKVAEIKRRLAAGERGRHLAAEFGVSEVTVSEIKSGKKWGHVPA